METERKYKLTLKEQIDHYNERLEEVFEQYYRRNTSGSEDTLEICVLRDANKLITRLINENQKHMDMVNVFLGLRDVYVVIDDEYVQWEPGDELESRGYDLSPEGEYN